MSYSRDSRAYGSHRDEMAAKHRDESARGRDIGPCPPVLNPARKRRCAKSLKLFLQTYFPAKFPLRWSPAHLAVIDRIEQATRHGGLFTLAMPRGSGKTTIAVCAAEWATLNGHRHFVALIGATEDAAIQMLDEIKQDLEGNELLYEDYPEVCHPIRALDGITKRIQGQTIRGQRTKMVWDGNGLAFPTVEGSEVSGTMIKVAGITGRVRGMKMSTSDGRTHRPDFVLVDDPQTDESAASPQQCRQRVRVLNGAILGLAGPGVKISGVMPCTIIRPDDMAAQMLNHKIAPDWNGETYRMLDSFPSNMDLWGKYDELRRDSLEQFHDIRLATSFYRRNRKAMDAGAKVYWPERHAPDELSGIQGAMNLYYRDRETFYAEYQNEPIPDTEGEDSVTVEKVWAKMDGLKRGEIPHEAEHVVAFIDVQGRLLYWTLAAFAEDFTGWIIDVGAWPRQKRRYFSLRDTHPAFEDAYPKLGLEGQVYQALNDCIDYLTHVRLTRSDGVDLRLERIAIDSGWGETAGVVYRVCQECKATAELLPSKGRGITAAQRPFGEYRREPGQKLGDGWRLFRPRAGRTYLRLLEYDTNQWKSFVRTRLLAGRGDRSSLCVFGSDAEETRLLAEHLSSETATPTEGNGRRVDVWKLLPGRENHWLDGVVGCHVLASLCGCSLSANGGATLHERPRKRLVALPNY